MGIINKIKSIYKKTDDVVGKVVHDIDRISKIPKNTILGKTTKKTVLDAEDYSYIPKIDKFMTDKSSAIMILRKLNESYNIFQNTTNPEVFFGRLNFSLDCLLQLMQYKISIFNGATPEYEYERILKNLENYVDEFIDRSYAAELKKIATLKTTKGKRNRLDKYVTNLMSAFENAHSFWSGNSGVLHYTGELYTTNNFEKVKKIYYDSLTT